MMSLDKINDFAREVHANARLKGWWDPDKPRSARATRALIASELTGEALEQFRDSEKDPAHMQVWFDGGCIHANAKGAVWMPPTIEDALLCAASGAKPEGFGIELADSLIRMLDWNAAREGFFSQGEIDMIKARHPEPFPLDVLTVPDQLDWAAEALYSTGMWRDFVQRLLAVAEANGVDLWECVAIKAAFNKTRPHRHGGKAA